MLGKLFEGHKYNPKRSWLEELLQNEFLLVRPPGLWHFLSMEGKRACLCTHMNDLIGKDQLICGKLLDSSH